MTARLAKTLRMFGRKCRREDGNTMVEMALMCAFVYLPMLFGTFQVSYGLYVYNYVCSVSHQATRYAAVRGTYSCTIESKFVDCNLNPTGATNPASGSGTPLENFVKQRMGFMALDSTAVTVTPTWYTRSNDNSKGFSIGSWDTPCTAAGCNLIGNAVQVAVTYNFPLNIPFWGKKTLPITGVSKMMISE